MPPSFRVALVGATGAVGVELLKLLEERSFPASEVGLYASPRSAGQKIEFRGQMLEVQTSDIESLGSSDLVFLSAGSEVSRKLIPELVAKRSICIDNSSAFRMDPQVPLVVPEINPEDIGNSRIIANPNCTAIILLMAVHPLRTLGTIKRLIVSTYQSASGAGAQGMIELEEQTRCVLAGRAAEPKVFPHPYAFNLFSHNTPVGDDGSNEEEKKVVNEVRKILGEPNLGVNVTCVRVPVLRAHTESVTIEFNDVAPNLHEVRGVLERAPGVRVIDNPEANHFPMPIEASGQNDVLVGRLRRDPSNEKAISLLVSGDQLLKGAALNAVQIAETILKSPRMLTSS